MPPARMRGALSGDMPELDRQMGCMAGIFQIFDRQRLITGRRAGRQPQKRLPPPPPPPSASGKDILLPIALSAFLISRALCSRLTSHISSFTEKTPFPLSLYRLVVLCTTVSWKC